MKRVAGGEFKPQAVVNKRLAAYFVSGRIEPSSIRKVRHDQTL